MSDKRSSTYLKIYAEVDRMDAIDVNAAVMEEILGYERVSMTQALDCHYTATLSGAYELVDFVGRLYEAQFVGYHFRNTYKIKEYALYYLRDKAVPDLETVLDGFAWMFYRLDPLTLAKAMLFGSRMESKSR